LPSATVWGHDGISSGKTSEATTKGKSKMTKRSEYKGHRLIVLDAEGKYPFQFGLAKAKLILANLEAIRAFVAEQDSAAPAAGQLEGGQ
jgi:hypothetical protein